MTVQVEDTAQKNTVLTLYELVYGEMTLSQGLLNMPTRNETEFANGQSRVPWHGYRTTPEVIECTGEERKSPDLWQRRSARREILLRFLRPLMLSQGR